MRSTIFAAIVLLAAVALPPSGLAAEQPPRVTARGPQESANALMQAFGNAKPGEKFEVSFFDADGKALDFSAFMNEAQLGQRFVIETDARTHTANWKLLPPGVSGEHSLFIKPPPSTVKPGSAAPALDLPLLAGGRIDGAGLRGKPYLVDFFFADCVGCIKELPVLNAYAKQYPGMQTLMVTFDDKATADAFVKKWRPAWPVAYAGQGFIDKAGVSVFPTLMLVDKDGRVRGLTLSDGLSKRPGELTSEDIQRWVTDTLAADPQPPSARP